MSPGRRQRSVRGSLRALAAPLLSVALSTGLSAGLVACEQAPPVPRIEPTLAGWSEPYQGLAGLRIHAFRTGAVLSPEGAVYAGGSWTSRIPMGAWAFVLEHPTAGLIVFDAGIAAEARTDPGRYVGWLGARFGLLDVPEGAGLGEQMRRAGLDPGDVVRVVLSHLHFDHTGALGDFPNAVVTVSSAEKDWAEGGVSSWDFVDQGALAGMGRWEAVDFAEGRPLATLLAARDLLGDGSVHALDLAGHTPGSMGLLVRTADAPVLLTGDAAWTQKSWRWPARPFDAWDMDLWWEQAWRIKKFALLEPRLVVVPGHDDEVVVGIDLAAFVVHEGPGVPQRDDDGDEG